MAAVSTPPQDLSRNLGLKPLTLSAAPRPLQLSSQPPSLPPSPSPLASPLSRSDSTNSRRASVVPVTTNKRPLPKRLSSISYSISPTVDTFSAAGPSLLRSLPAADYRGVIRPARPSSLPSPTPRDPGSDCSAPEAASAITPRGPKPSDSVLTLAERHSDLLRFIAAKESKCLELRTQLEQHEAELLVLKSKWERIVSKTKTKELGATAATLTNRDASPGVGGDVVEALKGMGRYLGGLGLGDDPTQERLGLSTRSAASRSISPTASSPSSVLPPLPAPDSALGQTNDDPWKFDSHQKRTATASRSSSPSSPASSALPSSTRDSLSSVSTASSSFDLAMMTPSSQAETTPTYHVIGDEQGSPWMPIPTGLNKKWEQIQKNSTFEKHSKRASLLISDVTGMSNSIFGSLSSALLSPPLPSSKVEIMTPTPLPPRQKKQRPVSMSVLPSSSRSSSAIKSSSPGFSLLDEDEEDAECPSLSKPILPSGYSPIQSAEVKKKPSALSPPLAADTEDDWNW